MAKQTTTENLSPEERIRIAEAEEIEALRDILKAEARSAAAEAQMMENLVEVDRAVGNAVMSLYGQGNLPFEKNPLPVWAGALLRKFGADAATELIKEGIEYVKDKLMGTGDKQKGRAEQTKQSANKESVIKGIKGDVIIQSGGTISSVSPGSGTSGATQE